MGNFQFRPAKREAVGLLVGLAGGTGSGKTYSALRLATGIAGPKPFCVIDTEAGRSRHYAGQLRFDVGDLKPPFSPDAYAEAILAADKAGYPVIVVDSMSHEHAGDGGLLDWHEAELERMAGSDYGKRERCTMAAWIKPKMSHKAMVQKLLQVRAHLILCFRAEEKIELAKDERGKTIIVPKRSPTGANGWIPVCEKSLPYELTASFLLTADAPGIPKPIKLQEQHKALFPAGKHIDEDAGKRIAAWAGGESTPVVPQPEAKPAPVKANGAKIISAAQLTRLHTLRTQGGLTDAQGKEIIGRYGFTSSKDITTDKYEPICREIERAGGIEEPEPSCPPDIGEAF